MESRVRGWGCYMMTASYNNVNNPTTNNYIPFEEVTVSVYPNPTTGNLKIESGELEVHQISIFNIAGSNLFNTQQIAFDISYLPAGIYFVQIKTEKGIVVRKIIKE